MINKVCIANNLYCLLFYLLLSDEKVREETFFFFDRNIPQRIVNELPNSKKYTPPTSAVGKILFLLKLRYIHRRKFPFLKTASIWGQDNLLITPPLLANRKMTVIEDGVSNYTRIPRQRSFKWIKKVLISPLMAQQTQGYSDSVDTLYLTGLAPVQEAVKHKVKFVNLNNLWENSSQRKKDIIMSVFGLSENNVRSFAEVDSILLTQPLSEDNVITEEEKIMLYRHIIGNKKVAIKPHPRERTNYKYFFPDVQILNNDVPIEILSLLDVKFSHVYTIFSTAALAFPYHTDVHFMGTQVHPALLRRFGDVRLIDGKLKVIK